MTDGKPPWTLEDWATVAFLVLPLVAILIAGAMSLVVTAPAAAQADEPSTLDRLTDADAGGVLDGLEGRIAGWVNARIAWLTDTQTTGPEACADLQSTFNGNASTIQNWTNDRINASTDEDVVSVTCDSAGETGTVYLTADVSNDSYANMSIDDNTTREADVTCRLTEDAAVNAADELATFISGFAAPGQDVSEEYRSRLAAQYAGDVSCDIPGVSG